MLYFKHKILKATVAGSFALVLSGCGAVYDQSFFNGFGGDQQHTQRAIGSVAMGNIPEAALAMDEAINSYNTSAETLVAAVVIYHAAGREPDSLAAQAQLMRLYPDTVLQLGSWDALKSIKVDDLPHVLARMEPVERAENTEENPEKAAVAMPTMHDDMASRFVTLQKLRDEMLMTPDEYRIRRQSNLGALLPLTESPPAAIFMQTAPTTDDIVGRLQALRRQVERGSISPERVLRERERILESLMPMRVDARMAPGHIPTTATEAKAHAQRINNLMTQDLITPEERQKELEALEKAVPGFNSVTSVAQPLMAQNGVSPTLLVPGQGRAMPSTYKGSGTTAKPMAGDVAGNGQKLHLASYKSLKLAKEDWANMRKKYPAELRGLKVSYPSVNVPGKGRFYRILAGPAKSIAAAKSLCTRLRAKGQFCDTMK